MAIGGFNGSDPSPTLAQFQQYVADGKIHYFIGGGGGGGRGGSSTGGSNASSQIAEWVAATLHRPDGRRHHGLRPDRPDQRRWLIRRIRLPYAGRRLPIPGAACSACQPSGPNDRTYARKDTHRSGTGSPQSGPSRTADRCTHEPFDAALATPPRPAGATRRCWTWSSRSTTRRSTSSRAYGGCTRTCAAEFPYRVPDHHRGQRQHRRHRRGGPDRLAEELPEVAVGAPGREGPRPGAEVRLDRTPTRPCSRTWTWTSPPTSARCCRWSRR